MKFNPQITKDLNQIKVVERLSGVFEGIASAGITRIRNRTLASQKYFQELWQLYLSLRVDPEERLTHATRQASIQHSKPQAYVIVTAEGTFSGNLDEQIIETALTSFKPETSDLIVVGSHGALLLAQRGIKPEHAFKLPDISQPDSFVPIARLVSQYPQPTVFYQTYESLAKQAIARIDLITAVRSLGTGQAKAESSNIITAEDYVFEPSLGELADFMESVMLQVALSQILLESNLAVYAARFKAMNRAHQKASDLKDKMTLQFNRSRRLVQDEKQKESLGRQKAWHGGANA